MISQHFSDTLIRILVRHAGVVRRAALVVKSLWTICRGACQIASNALIIQLLANGGYAEFHGALMRKLRVHAFGISVDGYGAGPSQSLENPLGIGGMALHAWMFPTRTLQRMFGNDGGTTGPIARWTISKYRSARRGACHPYLSYPSPKCRQHEYRHPRVRATWRKMKRGSNRTIRITTAWSGGHSWTVAVDRKGGNLT